MFKVVHRPGLGNISDFLSRHPFKAKLFEDKNENDAEDYINSIIDSNLPKSLTKEMVLEAINANKDMIMLKDSITKGYLSKKHVNLSKFLQIFNELSVSKEGLILRGTKLILPDSLHTTDLELAHDGHQANRHQQENNVRVKQLLILTILLHYQCQRCLMLHGLKFQLIFMVLYHLKNM